MPFRTTASTTPTLVFDAGALSRIYARDISTPNLRLLFNAVALIHAPVFVRTEIASTWSNFVRIPAIDARVIDLATYDALIQRFDADVAGYRVSLWNTDDLADTVRWALRVNLLAHLSNRAVPILHAGDAHYLALALNLSRAGAERVVLVTNDRPLWKAARHFGLEVYLGTTCDRGTPGSLHIGDEGKMFPPHPRCQPCRHVGCPSVVRPDFTLENFGSVTPP